MRDLPFIHRFHRPETEDGSTIILLHGTGGNEADLMPLAHKINPRATLHGVRGRSTEEGINRWFRRYNAMSYDQDDIRSEAEAFAAFTAEAIRGYGIDAAKLTFLGYSNGANLLASLLQLHPGVIRRAILLRSVQVLEEVPDTEASGESDVLLITGAHDPFALNAPKLEAALRAAGVTLSAQVIEAGHELTPEDLSLAEAWLTAEQAG